MRVEVKPLQLFIAVFVGVLIGLWITGGVIVCP